MKGAPVKAFREVANKYKKISSYEFGSALCQSDAVTPLKIRMLQRKLYQKAKEESNYRFYLLYDKMYREEYQSATVRSCNTTISFVGDRPIRPRCKLALRRFSNHSLH